MQRRSQEDDRQHQHRDGAEAKVSLADEDNQHQKDPQHRQDDQEPDAGGDDPCAYHGG